MSFFTKNLSPLKVNNTSARGGLDERDLVWRNPNPYLSDEEESVESNSNNENYGRRIEQIPRLIYTPVKVSGRKSTSGNNGKVRTVTNQEMDDLNACLLGLSFGGNGKSEPEDHGNSKSDGHRGNNESIAPPMGRITGTHVDKKGKTTRVWRSARVAANQCGHS